VAPWLQTAAVRSCRTEKRDDHVHGSGALGYQEPAQCGLHGPELVGCKAANILSISALSITMTLNISAHLERVYLKNRCIRNNYT
jgi:hypothetical protein